jgi:hypothetical protein
MGAEDIERQRLNVERMRLLGAEVREVTSGSETLKDATNEAIRDWVSSPQETFYIIGSVVGPHPYPMMVRDFHRVIGRETRRQLVDAEGRERPDALVACVGGGSNAIGLFHPFLEAKDVEIVGVEAAGEGLEGGVADRPDGCYLIMWAAAIDGDETTLGCGPRLRLTAGIADRVRGGEELGPVMDDVVGETDVKRNQGAAGVLTGGIIDREQALLQAVAGALGPFVTDVYRAPERP